eukprot:gb/GECG01010944.1/.p1 GENE.gb/GECG01010944.1/~~gb/GECG01010944.1/.p1  ORF type:complete len:519 (+),score=45.34 gb/GECG01010944.1/:1-1557(+)
MRRIVPPWLREAQRFRCQWRALCSLSPSLNCIRRYSSSHGEDGEPTGSGVVFESAEQHLEFLEHHARLPRGFKAGAKKLGFRPLEAPDSDTEMMISSLECAQPTSSFAAVFNGTSSSLGCPNIDIGRGRMEKDKIQSVLVHNKIANIGTKNGTDDAQRFIDAYASSAGLESSDLVFPGATGVIGWSLPINSMVKTASSVGRVMQTDSLMPLAMGIMTTDTFPKVRSAELVGRNGERSRIVATAKGAGMIAPNMATLLVYIATDAVVSREHLRSVFPGVINDTFNNINLDGVASPGDTAFAMSSNQVNLGTAEQEFDNTLFRVCSELSEDVVRNGEGVKHVISLDVQNCKSKHKARDIGRMITNSLLLKTMVAGNEPNIGRILSVIDAACTAHGVSLDQATVDIGGIRVFDHGEIITGNDQEREVQAHLAQGQMWESVPRILSPPVPLDEEAANKEKREPRYWVVPGSSVTYACPFMYPRHDRCVSIQVDLAYNDGFTSRIYGGDLTHEYVSLNSEYRT